MLISIINCSESMIPLMLTIGLIMVIKVAISYLMYSNMQLLVKSFFFDKLINISPSEYFVGYKIDRDSDMISSDKLKEYLEGKALSNVRALKDNRLTDIPSRYFGVSQPKELTSLFSGSKDSSNAVDSLISAYQVNIKAQVHASNTPIRVEVHKGKVSVTSLYEYRIHEKHDWMVNVYFGGIDIQR
nr:MAG TPA: hypothetical protein [Caudoviricetes sp.]